MTQPLSVLAVEDSADDVELIARVLKFGDYLPCIVRVDTRAALDSALKAQSWDIILADYRLPDFSGTEAIALVRTNNIETPIIVVSGTIGEEAAVEAMRCGADDYVLKEHLARLPDMVRRQLTDAQEQRTWRAAEIERRTAGVTAALEKHKLRDALETLSRGALYIAERLETDLPSDERRALLGALRESAVAARRVANEVAGNGAADGGR